MYLKFKLKFCAKVQKIYELTFFFGLIIYKKKIPAAARRWHPFLSEQKRPFGGLDSAKATMEDDCGSSTTQHQPMGMFNRSVFRLEVVKKKNG